MAVARMPHLRACDWERRVSGMRREPVVFLENPTLIPHPTEKEDPDPLVEDSDPLVASSVHGIRNERVGVFHDPRKSGSSFSVECGDQCWFSTVTTGSLLNPWTRRTPSCMGATGLAL